MVASLLNTSTYDNVVIIDTQVVLEAKPLDQLPWNELFPGSVLLLVCRQVQGEIDAKKNYGRIGKRARAFNTLLDRFIETRDPSPVIPAPRIDVALVANGRIDWSALDDLDRDDGDDRIVAQMLNALVDDRARLVLLSHDTRPRDAALTHGLRAVKPSESWLRDPEPSPDQRRITDLEGKVRLLSADQPRIEVVIQPASAAPWRFLSVGQASSEELKLVLEAEFANAPEPTGLDPFGFRSLSHDSGHGERLAEWRDRMRVDIPLMHAGLTRLFAQQRIKVSIENVGTVSAQRCQRSAFSRRP